MESFQEVSTAKGRKNRKEEKGNQRESSIHQTYVDTNLKMSCPDLKLPPGFRFHPTDEELVMHYLCRKCASMPISVPIIAEIDLYKFDPWQLPGMYSLHCHIFIQWVILCNCGKLFNSKFIHCFGP